MESANLELLFDPQDYLKNDPSLTIVNKKLSSANLLSYGELATKLRKKFTKDALKILTDSDTIIENLEEEFEKIPTKLQRKFLKPEKPAKPEAAIEGFEHTNRINRRNYRKTSDLTIEERSIIMNEIHKKESTRQ